MAKIQIYGKTYNLKSSSGEIATKEVADYVDSKMHELSEIRSKTPSLDLAVLAALPAVALLALLARSPASRASRSMIARFFFLCVFSVFGRFWALLGPQNP